MSGKPEDIPQDVWDTAFHEMDCHCPSAMMGEEDLQRSVHTAIARAILAAKAEEREACASLADDVAKERGVPGHKLAPTHINIRKAVTHEVALDIAAAIRKRGEG